MQFIDLQGLSGSGNTDAHNANRHPAHSNDQEQGYLILPVLESGLQFLQLRAAGSNYPHPKMKVAPAHADPASAEMTAFSDNRIQLLYGHRNVDKQ